MATYTSSQSLWGLVIMLLITSVSSQVPTPPIRSHGKFTPGPWTSAHATFYGGADGSETTGGSCGYQDTTAQGYGLQTAALSSVLYNDGQTCGACYEIKCDGSPRGCKTGQQSIVVTATNWCPPNYAQATDNGGWCNPPREHFDLSMPAFLQIGEYKAGIIPVSYRRVPCMKQGGIKFTINGHKYFNQVTVWNVAGSGDVHAVFVKGSSGKWTPLQRNWGQRWSIGEDLTGQSLSFRVKTGDKRKCTSLNVTSPYWQFGQTYEGNKNFR